MAGQPDVHVPIAALSEREIQTIRALAEGHSYDGVAAVLGVSVNTVRSHIRNVYRKLAVGTRTEAVLVALQLGLLADPHRSSG